MAEPRSNPSTEQQLQARFEKLRRYPFTQLGMAERFISEHGPDVRYCKPWKSWLVWNGARWEDDSTSAIYRRLHMTIRGLGQEAKRLYKQAKNLSRDVKQTEGILKGIISFAEGCEEYKEITAILNHAATLTGVSITPDRMDTHAMLFNCRNGVVDLETGKLISHDDSRVRGWLLTKQAPVEYHPNAPCKRWLEFLDEVFAKDAEKISYAQRAIGYGLTGRVTEKAMFFFHGGGNNGKTTLLEIVRSALGDYAGTVDIDMLMSGGRDDNTLRMIATMHGKRLVTASEASETSRFNESLIKRITGMGRLVGRRLFSMPFEYDPEFKIIVDANHRPTIRGTDDAIWVRVKLIPFEVKFSKKAEECPPALPMDKDLWGKLRAELPGILAWAVQGCLAWQHDGLEPPACITDATAAYRAEQDIVAEFLAEQTEPEPTATIRTNDFYTDFREWCMESGERDIPKQRWFTDRVQERFKIDHKRDGNHFLGVRLRSRIAEWKAMTEPMREPRVEAPPEAAASPGVAA